MDLVVLSRQTWFLRVLFKGSCGVNRRGGGSPGGVTYVTPRKRYSETGIRGFFVHSVCRRFGLKHRLGSQLGCGPRCR